MSAEGQLITITQLYQAPKHIQSQCIKRVCCRKVSVCQGKKSSLVEVKAFTQIVKNITKLFGLERNYGSTLFIM